MAALTDIRKEIPLAKKVGTAHKPAWEIDGKPFKFVQPVTKAGTDKAGKKVRLGKRTYARYKAGTTAKGHDLMFVGVFAPVAKDE